MLLAKPSQPRQASPLAPGDGGCSNDSRSRSPVGTPSQQPVATDAATAGRTARLLAINRDEWGCPMWVRYDISDRVYIDGENLVVEARPYTPA